MPQMWPMYWENMFLMTLLSMMILTSKFFFFMNEYYSNSATEKKLPLNKMMAW